MIYLGSLSADAAQRLGVEPQRVLFTCFGGDTLRVGAPIVAREVWATPDGVTLGRRLGGTITVQPEERQ